MLCCAALCCHAALQAARRKLVDAVACGYISQADRQTYLNPPDSVLLQRGDRLIVLSETAAPEVAASGDTSTGLDIAALQQQVEAATPPQSQPKRVVVVGWSGPLEDLTVRRWGGVPALLIWRPFYLAF